MGGMEANPKAHGRTVDFDDCDLYRAVLPLLQRLRGRLGSRSPASPVEKNKSFVLSLSFFLLLLFSGLSPVVFCKQQSITASGWRVIEPCSEVWLVQGPTLASSQARRVFPFSDS